MYIFMGRLLSNRCRIGHLGTALKPFPLLPILGDFYCISYFSCAFNLYNLSCSLLLWFCHFWFYLIDNFSKSLLYLFHLIFDPGHWKSAKCQLGFDSIIRGQQNREFNSCSNNSAPLSVSVCVYVCMCVSLNSS